MPLLSLPLPRIPGGVAEYLPIRVPFPFMRIASILPHSINEPMKSSLMALFRLAWSAKLQIPVLITVVFMACDIRLQLEINIFWETNNARPHAMHGSNRNAGQRRASREDMRRAALVAAALYQQQRRRLIQEMRAQQVRQLGMAHGQVLPLSAPLATEEDSDLEGSHDGNPSASDTLTYSHRSTTSEAGSFESDDDETDDPEDRNDLSLPKKKRRTRRSRVPSSEDEDENDDDDEEVSTTDEDEDDDNDGGMNGGSSSHGGGGGYRDDTYDDDDSDDMDDSSTTDIGGGYNSPLVLEIELRHRPLHSANNESAENCQMSTMQMQEPLRNTIYCRKSNVFTSILKEKYTLSTDRKEHKEPTNIGVVPVPHICLLL